MLLNKGCDVNLLDGFNNSALIYASGRHAGMIEIVSSSAHCRSVLVNKAEADSTTNQ